MSVKTDGGRRYVEMEVDLPGTPEQVWQAVATGPGYTAWFTSARIEERAGGAMAFVFAGGAESPATVTTWQPPHRFSYLEGAWQEGAPAVATEITIEALSGGTCRMRMVHSMTTDRTDWDADMESWESGWPSAFRVLRRYLEVAPGAEGQAFWPSAPFQGSMQEALQRLGAATGLTNKAKGDRVEITAGAPRLVGVVEAVEMSAKWARFVIALEAPTPGVAEFGAHMFGGPTQVAANMHFWGPGSDKAAEAARKAWPKLLEGLSPA